LKIDRVIVAILSHNLSIRANNNYTLCCRNCRSILEVSLGCQLAERVTANRYKQLNSVSSKDICSVVYYPKHNKDFNYI